MHINELSTPALLVHKNRLEANIARMQAKADLEGVALRPHTKTHKSVNLARLQCQAGAKGLTVAKVGEAEVFAKAGFKDLRLAYPIVGQEKHARILRLLQSGIHVSFCVDTPEGARSASDFYASHHTQVDVLIEVDVNYGRTGVPWNRREALDFVRLVKALPGLRLKGILCHAGQSYHGPEHEAEPLDEALARVAREERGMMLSIAHRMAEAGLVTPEDFEISIGSTPSVKHFVQQERSGFRITEIRPGNYVFNDGTQVALGVVPTTDCALTVLTTVVSRQRSLRGKDKLFLDAGKKILTSDQRFGAAGYGQILYNLHKMLPQPHTRITSLSEEHAWVQVAGGATLDVGDRVQILPNHACVVVHTQPYLYVVDGEEVIATWQTDARDGGH